MCRSMGLCVPALAHRVPMGCTPSVTPVPWQQSPGSLGPHAGVSWTLPQLDNARWPLENGGCWGTVCPLPAICRAARACCPPPACTTTSLRAATGSRPGHTQGDTRGGKSERRGCSFARCSRARLLAAWQGMHKGVRAARTSGGGQQEQFHGEAVLGDRSPSILSTEAAPIPRRGKGICNVPPGKWQPAQPGSGSSCVHSSYPSPTSLICLQQGWGKPGHRRQGHSRGRVSTSMRWGLRGAAAAPIHQLVALWVGDAQGQGEQEAAGGRGRCRLCAGPSRLQAGRAAWTQPGHSGCASPALRGSLPGHRRATKQHKDMQPCWGQRFLVHDGHVCLPRQGQRLQEWGRECGGRGQVGKRGQGRAAGSARAGSAGEDNARGRRGKTCCLE